MLVWMNIVWIVSASGKCKIAIILVSRVGMLLHPNFQVSACMYEYQTNLPTLFGG